MHHISILDGSGPIPLFLKHHQIIYLLNYRYRAYQWGFCENDEICFVTFEIILRKWFQKVK
jgi:hypothetical protein